MAAETTAPAATAIGLHPLAPLSPDEIARASAILKRVKKLNGSFRFETVELKEPTKGSLRAYRTSGAPVSREALLCCFDVESNEVFEASVDLDRGEIGSWRLIPNARPTIMPEELMAIERAVKADPRFAEALRQRGIEDVALAQVDPWSPGNYGLPDEAGRRVAHVFVWLKTNPYDNGYAHPVEGLNVVVDINKLEIVRIDDHGGPPVPMTDLNYAARFQERWRTDLKPLEIVQPDGPGFTVDGTEVRWQNWSFRVGFTGREGLVLHDIAFTEQGERRSIINRASVVEMVVPYGDPSKAHYRKNAFDFGEYGVGRMANSLKLGCDCLGTIHYFDAWVNNMAGEPYCIENAVCLHEEDHGILWKHFDFRTEETDVRRARRLQISFIATVGNYEYGFYWNFHQEGTINLEVKLTGIINTAGCVPFAGSQFGTEVAPGVVGQIHQHIFNARLDMAVDGSRNSVVEVDTAALPPGPANPHLNAFRAHETVLATEKAARRNADAGRCRFWKIVSHERSNAMGKPTAYRLMPHGALQPYSHPDSSVGRRAGFIFHHLWVTPFEESERFPAGQYVNQSNGEDGLAVWTERDRPVADTDLVVWHSFGHHHLPRLEDFPVQPVATTGFTLQPVGFFDRNPTLDVPPTDSKKSCCA